MTCEYCEIRDRNKEIIYQDNDVVVAVKDKVFLPGQITVFPKEHTPILETVPDAILEKCSIIANKVSMVVFETLSGQGTNILVSNGLAAGQTVPHFGIDVIPRAEGDKLNFTFEGKPLSPEDMDITLNTISKELEELGKETKSSKKEVKEGEVEVIDEDDGDNYLLKSIRKIP